MVISSEERESIISEAVERTLVAIPEVVGNLMMNYAAKAKAKEDFYKKYKEFVGHNQIVAATIEEEEGKDPTRNMAEIAEAAVPEIRKRISMLKPLDMKNVKRPNLKADFGEL